MEATTRWTLGFSYLFALLFHQDLSPCKASTSQEGQGNSSSSPSSKELRAVSLKGQLKKYCMASSVIFIDSRYICLKGMICRIYLVKRRLDTHEMWKHFSNKTYVGNVMNSRHSVLTEMGQLERWLISKILLEGLALREIILSETSQIRQIFAAQEQKCRVKAPCFRSYWGKLKEDDNNW